MRNLQVLSNYGIFGLCLTLLSACAQQGSWVDHGRFQTGEMHPFVQDSRTKHELLMDMRDGEEATDTNGMTWRLGLEARAVAGQPDAKGYIESDSLIK